MATQREALIAALKNGPVLLRYFKVTDNGASRFAIATLNQSLFSYTFKGGGTRAPLGLIRYWDLGKNRWRSFYIYNLEAFTPLR